MKKKLILALLVLCVSSFAFSQNAPKKPSTTATRRDNSDSLKAASVRTQPVASKIDPTQQPYMLVLKASDWNLLIQLLNQSEAPHTQVASFIDYINANAKPISSGSPSDSTVKKKQ